MEIDEGNADVPAKKQNPKVDFIWSLDRA